MKKSRFTNEQIAFALKQAESGVPIEEVCRKLGVIGENSQFRAIAPSVNWLIEYGEARDLQYRPRLSVHQAKV